MKILTIAGYFMSWVPKLRRKKQSCFDYVRVIVTKIFYLLFFYARSSFSTVTNMNEWMGEYTYIFKVHIKLEFF